MSEEGEDYLKIMKITCCDIYANPIMRAYVTFFRWSKWLLLICTAYTILKSFDFQDFLDFVPYAGLGTYGISVMTQVIGESLIDSDFRDGFFPRKSISPEIDAKIRKQVFWVNTWYLMIQTIFGLFVGILHNIPNEPVDRKFFYFYNFLKIHPFQGSEALGFVYRLMMIPFMHIISSGTYQGIYFMQNLKYQFLILEEHFKELMSVDCDREVDDILNDKEYQARTNALFKRNIAKYEQLLKKGLALNSRLGIFILFGAVTYIIGGAALLIYIYSGIVEHNALRPICILILFVTMLSGLMVAGQLLENQTQSLCDTTFNLPWYVWDRETLRIYQIFLPMVQQTFTLRFSRTMGLNYTLGMSIFRAVYQCASIISHM